MSDNNQQADQTPEDLDAYGADFPELLAALFADDPEVAELAWLEDVGEGWRYRCGQKLTAEEWPVPGEQLAFRHFDDAVDKVLY